MTSPTEHRTFLLTTGVEDGHERAEEAGFLPASEDVARRESLQVMQDWALMEREGHLEHLQTYARWFTDLMLDGEEASDFARLHTIHTLVTFGVAVIARLKHKGFLQTPEGKRLVTVAFDQNGNRLPPAGHIPAELMEAAAEMYEWQHGGKDRE